jgi:adenylate cyclase
MPQTLTSSRRYVAVRYQRRAAGQKSGLSRPKLPHSGHSRSSPQRLEARSTERRLIFCDLRGFTSFSHAARPEEMMGLVQEYYEALGSIITSYEATLTCFMGDGLMLLLNAPVPCPDPALRGVQMAMEMQVAVQRLMSGWRERGHVIGFGMGLAKGPAIVGRIGYEGRSDYTAIGNVVNLASRICGAAEDGQILMDAAVAAEIGDALPLVPLGSRMLRGLTETVSLFSVRPTAPNLTKLPPGKVLAVQRNAWQS